MTINFEKVSKSAATSKMIRLVGNPIYGTIGFCNIALKHTSKEDARHFGGSVEYWIEMSSTYHTEETMRDMYKTNGKSW